MLSGAKQRHSSSAKTCPGSTDLKEDVLVWEINQWLVEAVSS